MTDFALTSHSWFVLTEALPTQTTRYHAVEKLSGHPESLPVGTLVMSRLNHHKNVGNTDHSGASMVVVPVRGVEPTNDRNFRLDRLMFDEEHTAWRRWCDRAETVAHLKRYDDPTPVVGTVDNFPLRRATAKDVQALFDQVQNARARALDRFSYDDLDHYTQDVNTVLKGLPLEEQNQLITSLDSSPRARWESSGMDERRFTVRHARENGRADWVSIRPSTPRTEAVAFSPVSPESQASALLREHAFTMRWIARVGVRAAHDWLDEAATSALSFGEAMHAVLRATDQALQGLPSLGKPVWTIAEQERLEQLMVRTTQALTPWMTQHVALSITAWQDERVLAAQTLHDVTSSSSSKVWNEQAFARWQREALPLVVNRLLWDRKVEIDLHAAIDEKPRARRPKTPTLGA